MEFTGPKPSGTSRQSKPVTERRRSTRLVVHSPAYASLNGSPSAKSRDLNEILDITEDGASIQTSSPLEVDRNLNLSLDLSETKTRINAIGRVIWSNSAGRAGIRFSKLSGPTLRQLKEWLFVNVLTAFDHARIGTASDADPHTVVSSGPLGLSSAPGNISKMVDELPQNGSSLRLVTEEPKSPANDIQAELDAGAYSREGALQLIAERVLTLTRATGAAIALSEGEVMICRASAGSDAPPVGSRLQATSGFSGECVRTGRSLRCDDSENDDRVDRESCRALGVRSIVAVPIRADGHVTGLMEIFSSQPYAFNPEDISVLQRLSATVLSAAGHTVAAPVQPPTVRVVQPEMPAARPQAELSPDVRAGTVAATKPRQNFHKVLLAAAAITFIFVLVWLIAPSFTRKISQSASNSQNKETQTGNSKPLSVPVEVNDLSGLRKLAEQGDPAAQFALGARYATGEEVRQDYTEAVRWFALAADQGHILAQATLGAYYWAGRGVTPDLTKAYFWSALAQAGGDQASKYRVAVLTSRMSRAEIVAAQQQANDWLRNHQMAGKASP
jgi:GAF domain/PilZ domain/Sel1 repeat